MVEKERCKKPFQPLATKTAGHMFLWIVSKVMKTFPGSDGQIRIAEIQINTKLYTRPVVRLIPLPVFSEEDVPVKD